MEICTDCGCVVDGGCCLCPGGRPAATVPDRPIVRREVAPSYVATIFLAGDVQRAEAICRRWCDRVGGCVTVEPTNYIYTGGSEVGVRVGFINYPRFPSSPDAIFERAAELAEILLRGLDQDSCSIAGSDRTLWLSRRAAVEAEVVEKANR